jgi:hypothetical protein
MTVMVVVVVGVMSVSVAIVPVSMTGMDPLHATIEEFAADGHTHIECYCPRCRATRLRPISWLPRISMGLNGIGAA